MPQFIDQIGGVGGTPLNAAALDAEVVASSYLVSGGIPTTFNNFTITQPATSAVINAGAGSAVYVPAGGGVVAACQLTMTASSDNYVDLLPTGAAFPASGVGAYVITAVANGAGAPALTSGNMRLYKAVSGGGAVTSILALGTTYPVSVAMVPAGVASGLATLDATAHVTPAQLNLGVASGLATLDSSSRVVQAPVRGVRQVGTLLINGGSLSGIYPEAFAGYNAGNDPWSSGTATLSGFANASNAFLSGSALAWGANWGGANPSTGGGHTGYTAQNVSLTTTGGAIRVDISGSLYNYYAGGGNWAQLFGLLDATGAGGIGSPAWYAFDNLGSPAGYSSGNASLAASGYGTFRGSILFIGLAAGVHTFIPLLNAGGPSGNCVVGFKSISDSNRSYFTLTLTELA